MKKESKWTLFWDMNSGGGRKEKWDKIYIEAPEDEAKIIFYNRFGHSPERVSCTCCGEDYSISTGESLEQESAYHRNCDNAYFDKAGNEVPEKEAWISGKGIQNGCVNKYVERIRKNAYSGMKYIPLSEYVKQDDVLIIYAKDIKDEERKGEVPEQGYVWAG